MEESEQRHSVQLRDAITTVANKLESHIKDDFDIQRAIQMNVQSLMESRTNEEKTKTMRQGWLIALSSLAGAAALKALDFLFRHP